MARADCALEELYAAIPRSRDTAASARDIANVHDWTISSVHENLENIGNGSLPGVLKYFEANHQAFYWIEGAIVKKKQIKWNEYMLKIPIGEKNAKTRLQIDPDVTIDQSKGFMSTIRKHTEDTRKELRSKKSVGGAYVYWLENVGEPIDDLFKKICTTEGVTEVRVVVEREGVRHTFEKVGQIGP